MRQLRNFGRNACEGYDAFFIEILKVDYVGISL